MPYEITYHLRGTSKSEVATVDTATAALGVVDDIERLNEIVDIIMSPDGRMMRINELMIIAASEKNADRT